MAPIPEEGENDAKPHNTNTDPIDDFPVPDAFINAGSSDSEDDDDDDINENGFHGYQMLPQDNDDNDSGSSEDSSVEEINADRIDEAIRNNVSSGGGGLSYLQVPPVPKPDAQELLWNQSRDDSVMKLDREKTEKIKTVMQKIHLPQSSIPEWAKNIPEDQWKETISKLKDKHL